MGLRKQQPEPSTSEDERRLPRDLQGLLAALQDADPLVRRWAARDLAAYPESSTALMGRLATETEPSVIEVILTSLTQIGDADAVVGLTDYLRSGNAMLRNAVIEVLKKLPNQVAPRMDRLLEDPDPDVRIFAVNILESLRHPQVEDWLIRVITRDGHINVCATAVDLLGEVGSERAVPALQALKGRFAGEPYIQFAADLALKRVSAD